ncbi:MAG: succinate dehydrogenase assembly factor 2 [Cocleimonas sp.]|nr:succinate dehydrogenase assembly factor 2 [Cocleimonas sp.]
MSEYSELKWRCRRGIKELDIILCYYLDTYYEKAKKEERFTFKQLLELEDPTLYGMLLGNIASSNSEQKKLLVKLRKN